MRHRLEWFIYLRAHGPSKGDEHPTNTPHGYGTLYLFMHTGYDANGAEHGRDTHRRLLSIDL